MKRLFVVMPFGPKKADDKHNTDVIDFDYVYKQLIRLAGESAGFEVIRIDEVIETGQITHQYLKEILEADVVLGDISLPNANVYYELGVRQAISTGSTILIALEGSSIPFDLANQRVFFYNLTEEGIEKARVVLTQALSLQAAEPSENPIRSFLEKVGVTASPKTDLAAFEQELQGRIQRAQNREQLIATWKWAQNLSPLPPFTLLTLARQLSNYNEWSHSVEVLRAAVDRRPNDFELYRELGWHLSKLGPEQYEESIKCFNKALSLNPDDPETLGMMGGVFKRQGDYEEASKYYSKGAKISPHNLYMLVNQAAMQILLKPDQPDQGITLYHELKHRILEKTDAPLDEWDEVVLGEALFVIGDAHAAKEHFIAASNLTHSPKSLRSAAEQIELFGAAGFNSDKAQHLAKWLRSISESTIEHAEVKDVTVETGEAPDGRKLPVILHLSDIHFGKRVGKDGQIKDMHRFRDGEYSRKLSQHVINEFTSKHAHFRHSHEQLYLLISGDIVYTAQADEFQLAREFLVEVCEGLNISSERVCIVPGNHDVNWKDSESNKRRRFDNYIGFLISFYGEEIFRARHPRFDWDLKFNSERPEAWKLLNIYHDPEASLTILGLNSCVYETHQDHYGFIGGRQIRAAEELLEEQETSSGAIRVAMFHHHLHPLPELVELDGNTDPWVDISIIRDSGIVERQLERLKFDVILHGHKHKPQLRETTIRNLDNGNSDTTKLIVCGAGSVGVNSVELEHNISNHYQAIEVLRNPRRKGVDFLKVEWRTLEVSPEAEWATTGSWIVTG